MAPPECFRPAADHPCSPEHDHGHETAADLARPPTRQDEHMNINEDPRQKAAALSGLATNPGFPAADRLAMADQAYELLAAHIQGQEAKVEQWIRDHAYAPDDIVLSSHSTLDSDGLANIGRLLDVVHPEWRNLFGDRHGGTP